MRCVAESWRITARVWPSGRMRIFDSLVPDSSATGGLLPINAMGVSPGTPSMLAGMFCGAIGAPGVGSLSYRLKRTFVFGCSRRQFDQVVLVVGTGLPNPIG